MTKMTEKMTKVLGQLNAVGGSAFAKEVKVEGATLASVNATLAALAGEKYGMVSKAKAVCGEKFLTKYTLTEAGKAALADPAE